MLDCEILSAGYVYVMRLFTGENSAKCLNVLKKNYLKDVKRSNGVNKLTDRRGNNSTPFNRIMARISKTEDYVSCMYSTFAPSLYFSHCNFWFLHYTSFSSVLACFLHPRHSICLFTSLQSWKSVTLSSRQSPKQFSPVKFISCTSCFHSSHCPLYYL